MSLRAGYSLIAVSLLLSLCACQTWEPSVDTEPSQDKIRAILDSILAQAPPAAAPAVSDNAVTPSLRDQYLRLREGVYLLVCLDADGYYQGHGTAFAIVQPDVLVTNHHVIEDAFELLVVIGETVYPVMEVLAFNEDWDYAVLRMYPDFPGRTVLPVASGLPQVGEPCFAIGNPGDASSFVNTLTTGIISNFSADYRIISSTASIAPGSSGGPLFNERGEVIGITTAYNPFADMFNYSGNIHNLPRELFGGRLPSFTPPANNSQEVQVREWLERYLPAIVNEDAARLRAFYAARLRRHHGDFAVSSEEAVRADIGRSWAREPYMVSMEAEMSGLRIEPLPAGLRVIFPVRRFMLPPGGGHREYRETWEVELDPAGRIVGVSVN
jgi:serine protease Do